jgi:hypothetical protein
MVAGTRFRLIASDPLRGQVRCLGFERIEDDQSSNI